MSTISLFQYLPYHVVQLIIYYVVGRYRVNSEGVITGLDKRKTWLKPLLWVCSSFRAIALPLYCPNFSIDFTSYPPGWHKEHCPFTDCPDISASTHGHSASALDISVDEWDVYTGEALKRLSLAPYDDFALPMARIITLYFACNIFKGISAPIPLSVEINITAFIQRIRQMAPKPNNIRVIYYHLCSQSRRTHYFGGLVSQLFQLARRVEYFHNFETDVPVRLQLDAICNLVHLCFAVDGYTCPSIQLARQNAPTLQSLMLVSDSVADIAGLIHSPDGSYVTYPHLRTLDLDDDTDDYTPERVAVKGVVPFPSLRRIRLRSCYPFGDDVLFRGNSGTLERLELLVSDLLVSIIIDHNIFTSTSHPRLQRIVTRYPIDDFPSQFDTPADTLRFMLSIGPGAPIRKVEGDHSSSELVPTLLSTFNYASIQVLAMPYLSLELLDVITLVKALPVLSTLCTSPPVIGSIPNHVDKDKLPAYVTATYTPIGKRFRYRNYQPYPSIAHVETALCVLLLALVFPNYTFSDEDGGEAKGFIDEVEATIASDMFKPYASRLESFLQRCMEYF